MPFTIRPLTPDDWQNWRAIRLEGLQTGPEAFGRTYEEEAGRTDAQWQDMLKNPEVQIFAAFDAEGTVCGMAVLAQSAAPKVRHRGSLVSVFVSARMRGQGLAKALIDEVIAAAQAHTEIHMLYTTVVASNTAAYALYEKLGFALYGTEPKALYANGTYYDEHLLALDLNKEAPA
mgnify:CR=1 FL=1